MFTVKSSQLCCIFLHFHNKVPRGEKAGESCCHLLSTPNSGEPCPHPLWLSQHLTGFPLSTGTREALCLPVLPHCPGAVSPLWGKSVSYTCKSCLSNPSLHPLPQLLLDYLQRTFLRSIYELKTTLTTG